MDFEVIKRLKQPADTKIVMLVMDGLGGLPGASGRGTELEVAHIPEDREKHGLVMAYTIADNLVLNNYFPKKICSFVRKFYQWELIYLFQAALVFDKHISQRAYSYQKESPEHFHFLFVNLVSS